MSANDVQNPPVENDEIPTLEAVETQQTSKPSKRYAKAMAKMGLKPEPNIAKAHIRKRGANSFVVNQPEVYRFPGTNTFLVFGEAQLGEAVVQAQEAAARAVSGALVEEAETTEQETTVSAPAATATAVADTASSDSNKTPGDDDTGPLEFDEEIISVAMEQGNTDRAGAIRALRNNNGDLVNAVMELSVGPG